MSVPSSTGWMFAMATISAGTCLALAQSEVGNVSFRLHVFPLCVHVARAAVGAAEPVVSDAWIAEQIATANALFLPHSVGFRVVERRVLADVYAELETRRDRDALGALVDPARIDVFVVRALFDVDDPGEMRRGVHWRPAGRPGVHFVVVRANAGPIVLAHELGHYFGNPHSSTPGNVMSYDRGEGPPFFDALQGRRIRSAARRFAVRRSPAIIEGGVPSAELPPETR
jgi:hypothetical protein